jgi:hypothetical protein
VRHLLADLQRIPGLGDAARAFTELGPAEAVEHVADLLAVGWL